MGRKVYCAPATKLFQVELEGAFASSIVQNQGDGGVTSTGHELNEINGFDTSGNAVSWNDAEWK